jgi:putative flippase GtrA
MRWLKYVSISAACALVQLLTLYLLHSVQELSVHLSAAIAYIVAVSLHFVAIRKFCFSGKSIRKEVTRFILVNLGGLAMNVAIMALLIEILHVWYIAAQLITLLMLLTYTFNMHKRVTFCG